MEELLFVVGFGGVFSPQSGGGPLDFGGRVLEGGSVFIGFKHKFYKLKISYIS